MRFLGFFVSLILLSFIGYSQSLNFEGELLILYTNGSETAKYNIKIKENRLKIDFYTSSQENYRTLLIDLKENKIFELNNLRKNFRPVNPNSFQYTLPKYKLAEDVKDIKYIYSYPCEKWTLIEMPAANESVFRIVKSDKFIYLKESFKYLNISNSTFKFIDFFARNENIIPLTTVIYNKKGNIISSIVVNSIIEKEMDFQEFEIPSQYKAW